MSWAGCTTNIDWKSGGVKSRRKPRTIRLLRNTARCLFLACSYSLLSKKFQFDNTWGRQILSIFPTTEKLFHTHFRNKPAERVFCLSSVQTIRRTDQPSPPDQAVPTDK